MNLKLEQVSKIKDTTLQITGSKSETNRLLILQALFPGITITNVSNSDDSKLMQKALQSNEELIDIHHAGTAMRFLTAYFSILEGRETVLTGSQRMKERPIQVLVEALEQLGCEIKYENNHGYPPIRIFGKQPESDKVTLKANISSQYISALMLIAASLPKGLKIKLEGKITSVPYINMTLHLLKDVGISGTFEGDTITIEPQKTVSPSHVVVESDWSSVSYFYSILALSNKASLTIGSYKKQSYQGDAKLAQIYEALGVQTIFGDDVITLKKIPEKQPGLQEGLDLSDSPDIAQTIAVTCFGLGIGCCLTGLHTLKIKETDRLEALKAEIEKLGGTVSITEDSLRLEPANSIKKDVTIATYHDHRMAMAFAPLALKTQLYIEDAEVVSKSYPDFWSDLKKLGFIISSAQN